MSFPQLNDRVILDGKSSRRVGIVTAVAEQLYAIRWVDSDKSVEPSLRHYQRLKTLTIDVGATVVHGTLTPSEDLVTASARFGSVLSVFSATATSVVVQCLVHWDDNTKTTHPMLELLDINWIPPLTLDLKMQTAEQWMKSFSQKRHVDFRQLRSGVYACKRNSDAHQNQECACNVSPSKRAHRVCEECMCSLRVRFCANSTITFSGCHTYHVPGQRHQQSN
jgi:hypothetical protein